MILVFGFGYSGRAIAKAAAAAGHETWATSRDPESQTPEPNITLIPFEQAELPIRDATHIVITAPPNEAGDPVLARYAPEIQSAQHLRWIGYLSTTGVYGNRDGAWVDETTTPDPTSPRAARRIAAEAAWEKFSKHAAVDIFRLAGIYGPGRSMFDDLRDGVARRVVKPGHLFGRIHRDDIASGILAAIRQNALPGARIFNFADDEPAASADVVVEAARLLEVAPPDAIPYEQALPKMSPMAVSFWADNRKVASARTKAALGIKWKYPTYREGLRAILAEESKQKIRQQP